MNSHKSTLRAVRHLPALLALASLTPVYSSTPRETALADQPLAYYELGVAKESTPVIDAISGAAVGTHAATLPATFGALFGSTDQATSYDGISSLTTLPYNATWNPAAGSPFTFEIWVQPNVEGGDTPQVIAGNGNQQGWKITQGKSIDSVSTGYTVSFYSGSATPSIQLSGGSYTIGNFSHIVVTYDGSTAKLYVDAQLITTKTSVVYTPNSSQAMTLGGDTGATKLFTGLLDEVAFYPSVLGQTEILSHYNNAFDTEPAQSYDALVKSSSPKPIYYLRLDEKDPNRVVAINAAGDPSVNPKSLGAAGNVLQFPGVGLQVPGALAGSTDTAVHYDGIDKTGFNGAYSTVLPYDEKLNTQSFSAEAWIRPLSPSAGNNANVFRNHNDGGVRSGWVVWQNPASTNGYSLRLYNHDVDGNNSPVKAINLSAGTYTQGQWQHLVVTFDYPTRTATMYLNGASVGTQTITASASNYAPLTREEGFIPSFGGFSDGYQNPFIGDMDEVAYYDKALTASQVAAHYTNGTNASRTTPYETLIANDQPVAYYRQNEAAKVQVPNLVTAHPELVGTAVNAPTSVAGPGAPADPGFPANTKANDFNGANSSYIELNNPAALNNGGAITLEAWIQPDAEQPFSAYIIGHGGNSGAVPNVGFREVFLRIEDGKYEVGDNSAVLPATFPVPATDLGTGAWIHLAGTWSNGTWTLYRNGESVATAPDATGPQQIVDANWAIGARGRRAVTGYPAGPIDDQRVFNGPIATAGIYGSALSLTQIKAHYDSGATLSTALSPLVIVQVGNMVKLTWSTGTLSQSSDLVNWTDVTSAVSPYTTTVSGKQFFRLHN